MGLVVGPGTGRTVHGSALYTCTADYLRDPGTVKSDNSLVGLAGERLVLVRRNCGVIFEDKTAFTPRGSDSTTNGIGEVKAGLDRLRLVEDLHVLTLKLAFYDYRCHRERAGSDTIFQQHHQPVDKVIQIQGVNEYPVDELYVDFCIRLDN